MNLLKTSQPPFTHQSDFYHYETTLSISGTLQEQNPAVHACTWLPWSTTILETHRYCVTRSFSVPEQHLAFGQPHCFYLFCRSTSGCFQPFTIMNERSCYEYLCKRHLWMYILISFRYIPVSRIAGYITGMLTFISHFQTFLKRLSQCYIPTRT